MIYGYYGHAFDAWHLVVISFVSFIFGHSARLHFKLARRVGLPIGFAVAGLLTFDGIVHSKYQPEAFINNEFMRLLFLVFITTNISSAIFGYLEPAMEHYRASVAARRLSQEKAIQEHQRKIANAKWEAERPQREAEQEERIEAARRKQLQQRAREAQFAHEKAAAEAAAKVKAALDASRRDHARQTVQLAFFAASPKVQQAISWDWLKEYISTYLSDKTPADKVEENAKRIVRTIKSHANPGTRPTRKPRNLTEVIKEFQQKKVEIENLPLAEDDRAALLADLEMQHSLALESCK